jgi:hypothetical protein
MQKIQKLRPNSVFLNIAIDAQQQGTTSMKASERA